MTKSRAILLALAAGVLIAACNTVEGVGKDVASVGKTVADAAK